MEPTQLLHRVLVFDVETTGLIPKFQHKQKQVDPALSQDQDQDPNPHILQLSFVIFDTQVWRVVTSYDAYIKVDRDIVISPVISELTGITRAMCEEYGVPIADAMREFHDAYMSCDAVVAHNLEFDREMVRIEMARLQNPEYKLVFDPIYEEKLNKQLYCTMRMGKSVCRIERIDRFGQTYFKSPKLAELYEHLFSEPAPDGLHNSLIDTYVCLRCFVRLRFRFDLRKTAFPMTLFSPSTTISTTLSTSTTVMM